MVYQTRMQKYKNSGEPKPPQSLNPLIRGLRLAFVLLFTAFDIGQALYVVSKGQCLQSQTQPKSRHSSCRYLKSNVFKIAQTKVANFFSHFCKKFCCQDHAKMLNLVALPFTSHRRLFLAVFCLHPHPVPGLSIQCQFSIYFFIFCLFKILPLTYQCDIIRTLKPRCSGTHHSTNQATTPILEMVIKLLDLDYQCLSTVSLYI